MRARLKKRRKPAVSNLISLVEGLRGNKGMSRRRERREAILQSTVGVLIYLHTHQQNYRSINCKHTYRNTDTYAHTPTHTRCPYAAGKLSTCSNLCDRVAWISTPLL